MERCRNIFLFGKDWHNKKISVQVPERVRTGLQMSDRKALRLAQPLKSVAQFVPMVRTR